MKILAKRRRRGSVDDAGEEGGGDSGHAGPTRQLRGTPEQVQTLENAAKMKAESAEPRAEAALEGMITVEAEAR